MAITRMISQWAALLLLIMMMPVALAGWDYEVIHEFEKPGTQPVAPLVLHGDGNYYGTTVDGGVSGMGTVFKMSPAGTITTLTSFSGIDGAAPVAGLCEGIDGALFGTTSAGGAGGFGIAFKITTAGDFTKLADFTGTTGVAMGAVPGALVRHGNGLFYGTTEAGGTAGHGTVFSMSAAGGITTLVEFTGTAGAVPGSMPLGRLAVSGTTLYGVTREGGAGDFGTVFKVTTAGVWTSMAVFTGTAGAKPGANPSGSVVLHSSGAMFGLTEFGGTNGFGTAFRLTTVASPVFTVLRHFADPTGSQPVGSLVEGGDAALYGATSAGGTIGWGTLFRLTTAGAHSVLTNFTGEAGAAPGSTPRASLIVGNGGDLYGTTSAGGPGNLGVICKVTPGGSFTRLANFSLPLGWTPSGAPVADGVGGILFPVAEGGDGGGGALLKWSPENGVVLAASLGGASGDAPDGGLVKLGADYFGVTSGGGASGRGTAFNYNAVNGATLLANFTTTDGSSSEGALTKGSDGALYGVSREGGSSTRGTIFRLTTTGARTRLVSFSGAGGAVPGRTPRGPLALAGNGDFYGVTQSGGSANTGVLFRISHAGDYSILAEFGSSGPRLPQGGLAAGSDGFLYGTTSAGGAMDAGTLLRGDPSNDSWTAVADFAAGGQSPAGELSVALDGRIWGMTTAGAGGVFTWSPGVVLEQIVPFSGTTGATRGVAAVDAGAGVIFTGGLLPLADGSVLGVAAGGGALGGGVLFRLTQLTPIQEWKLTHFGNSNAPDLEDADHDGLVNLVEYALGLLPLSPDSAGAPQAEITSYPEGDRLSLIVPRDTSRTDLTVIVESSLDLRDPWTPLATSAGGQPFSGPGYVSGDSPADGLKSVEVRALTNIESPGRTFVRIRVVH